MSLNHNQIPKPNFIIIGSAKCGTTSLADLLAQHPDCCFSRPKEVRFFDLDKNYNKGWQWYQQAFSHYNGEKMIGEATPNYTAMPLVSQCAERIYEFNPETKIIYIVRHPYQRLVSSWKMHYRNSEEQAHQEACQGFEYYLKNTHKKYHYLDHCLFDYQLSTYRKIFPEKQILVLFLEDWIAERQKTSLALCNFLELKYDRLPNFSSQVSNSSAQKVKTRKFFRYLGQAAYLKPIIQLIPVSIRKSILNSSIGSKPFVYPPLEISSDYKQEILNYLKKDAVEFLQRYGKSESYWNLDNI